MGVPLSKVGPEMMSKNVHNEQIMSGGFDLANHDTERTVRTPYYSHNVCGDEQQQQLQYEDEADETDYLNDENDNVQDNDDDDDDDIFGKVRVRRDFSPLNICLKPILPQPFYDLSYTTRSGWRYQPTAPFWDRLESGRYLHGEPTADMQIPPPSWTSRIVVADTEQQQQQQQQQCQQDDHDVTQENGISVVEMMKKTTPSSPLVAMKHQQDHHDVTQENNRIGGVKTIETTMKHQHHNVTEESNKISGVKIKTIMKHQQENHDVSEINNRFSGVKITKTTTPFSPLVAKKHQQDHHYGTEETNRISRVQFSPLVAMKYQQDHHDATEENNGISDVEITKTTTPSTSPVAVKRRRVTIDPRKVDTTVPSDLDPSTPIDPSPRSSSTSRSGSGDSSGADPATALVPGGDMSVPLSDSRQYREFPILELSAGTVTTLGTYKTKAATSFSPPPTSSFSTAGRGRSAPSCLETTTTSPTINALASSTSLSGRGTSLSDNNNIRQSTSQGGCGTSTSLTDNKNSSMSQSTSTGRCGTSVSVSVPKPKAALYHLYGKKRKVIVLPEHYLTWDNRLLCREQLFTSIFICPTTKEVFLAGPWDDHSSGTNNSNKSHHQYIEEDGMYWYPRKSLAEHAAAARAWDCIQFRDGNTTTSTGTTSTSDASETPTTVTTLLGGLQPYLPSQRPTLPIDRIPPHILELLPSTS